MDLAGSLKTKRKPISKSAARAAAKQAVAQRFGDERRDQAITAWP